MQITATTNDIQNCLAPTPTIVLKVGSLYTIIIHSNVSLYSFTWVGMRYYWPVAWSTLTLKVFQRSCDINDRSFHQIHQMQVFIGS